MSVAVIGGGLAGLAATVALSEAGVPVTLFEARSKLGGRASSFRDPATGDVVDNCQHVSMGCCVNLADFCRRVEIDSLFRREKAINFIGPDRRLYQLGASRWLPAPLHLGPSFWRLSFLSIGDRWRISRAMWRLMRLRPDSVAESETIAAWLARNGQSVAAIERFWSVVLVSALGETLDRASLAAARKVFVDGFLASREACALEVPEAPLGELYGERMEKWLAAHGAQLRLGAPVTKLSRDSNGFVIHAGGEPVGPCQQVVLATAWKQAHELLSTFHVELSWLDGLAAIESSPITGVHLWFDRPITTIREAALVGKLGQWIFSRGERASTEGGVSGHYYQIVISASRSLAGRDRQEIVNQLHRELAEIWPIARGARLIASRVVTDPSAVFSPLPGVEKLRPEARTAVDGLYIAGDWTATGWPATMEGAVRSGYAAADALLGRLGRAERFLVPDRRKEEFARWLCR